MSSIQKIFWIGCVSAMATISSGCSSNSNSHTQESKANPTQVSSAPSATATTVPTAGATSLPAAKSVSLIKDEVPEYDGSGRAYMTGGTELKADYSSDRNLPLAVFMPENLIRFERNGRTAWGTSDKSNWISFRKIQTDDSALAGAYKPEIADGAAALLQYKEYQGGYPDGNSRVDVFRIRAKEEIYQAEIRTTPAQREELLPLFIDILREVQYMKKQTPLVAGVFIQEPNVGVGKENRQMLNEVMICLQAIVAHDKKKFMSTMYSPETGDYLSFFINTSTSYRFTEMTYEGIPAEGTQRANFDVSFQYMTDEGYQADQSYTISLLRTKQGEWKVANID
ncbi:hypothetical protein [Paenibacillus helianthi]|uniref:hypothetical protein n=1 Tax=Paenibacillus helianthi TaxID=1349432 RepID=UPI000A5A7EE4|nr:hypothetical protein [Paenibacillus helianthi]